MYRTLQKTRFTNLHQFSPKMERSDQRKKVQSTRVDARKQRVNTTLTIRKTKRLESLMKKRSFGKGDAQDQQPEPREPEEDTSSEEDAIIERLPEFCYAIISGTESQALEGVRHIRDLLSLQDCVHISTVIDCGIIPRLVEFLSYENNPEFQFEAAWTLCNIAYGTKEQTDVIVRADCVKYLVKIISSYSHVPSSSSDSSPNSSSSPIPPTQEESNALVEQSIWCLGNILSDGRENIRLWCLENGILDGLSRFIEDSIREVGRCESALVRMRHAAWMLRLLAKSSDYASGASQKALGAKYLTYLTAMVSLVCKLMRTTSSPPSSFDSELLCNACAAAHHLTIPNSKPNIFNQAVASDIPSLLSSIFDKIEAAGYPDYLGDVYLQIVRVAGNIASGNVIQTDRVMTPSIMRSLYYLANSVTTTIVKKEVWWAVSNMAAGNHAQIQSVLDFGLVDLAVKSCFVCPFAIKQECFYVLSNIVTGCTAPQLACFLDIPRSLEALCESLDCTSNIPLITIALKAIERLLNQGAALGTLTSSLAPSPNLYRVQIEKVGGLEKIEKLQSLDDDKVFEAARDILLRYFDAPAVPDFVPDCAPAISPSGQSFLFSGE